MSTKQELRKQILSQRRQMDPAQVAEKSILICDRVRETAAYQDAGSLCVYMPIRNEAEADRLIEPALAQGKRVYIPKVCGEEMVFNAYEPGNLSQEGPYHIRESLSEEILRPGEDTLIIMPGAVFDPAGHRIGYGGGYYDRYLAQWPMCRTLAICYDFQIVPSVPAQAHDRCPQIIVSESRTLYIEGMDGAGEGPARQEVAVQQETAMQQEAAIRDGSEDAR